MGSFKKWPTKRGQRRNARQTTGADKAIGAMMRAIRIDKGMSQSDLANGLKLTFQQVQKYEQGRNRLSLSRAVEVAKILNVSLDELTGRRLPQHDAVAFNLTRYKMAKRLEFVPENVALPLLRFIEVLRKT